MTDAIDHGPAVHDRCKGHKNPDFDYPARFGDRVPKTIRMIRSARTDVFCGIPVGKVLLAQKGEEYPAWTNRHGAVCAIFPDGEKLGVVLDEFEVVEWLDTSGGAA